MYQSFKDRREAGIALAAKLADLSGRSDAIVLALPRGGVPVAFEAAKALHLPLDVLIVRKLGVPGQQELALGAIASGGARFLNEGIVSSLQIPPAFIEKIVERETAELRRRELLYRGERPPIEIRNKTVILIDDGLATGASMRVAIKAVRKQGPKEIIVAVPVAAAETCEQLQREDDVRCVCVFSPERFYAVGVWYQDFSQTTDEEVEWLLAQADVGAVYARHFV